MTAEVPVDTEVGQVSDTRRGESVVIAGNDDVGNLRIQPSHLCVPVDVAIDLTAIVDDVAGMYDQGEWVRGAELIKGVVDVERGSGIV